MRVLAICSLSTRTPSQSKITRPGLRIATPSPEATGETHEGLNERVRPFDRDQMARVRKSIGSRIRDPRGELSDIRFDPENPIVQAVLQQDR